MGPAWSRGKLDSCRCAARTPSPWPAEPALASGRRQRRQPEGPCSTSGSWFGVCGRLGLSLLEEPLGTLHQVGAGTAMSHLIQRLDQLGSELGAIASLQEFGRDVHHSSAGLFLRGSVIQIRLEQVRRLGGGDAAKGSQQQLLLLVLLDKGGGLAAHD